MVVRYSLSATVNIGNYQSLRPQVDVELTGDNVEELYKEAKELVKKYLNEELKLIKEVFPKSTFTAVH